MRWGRWCFERCTDTLVRYRTCRGLALREESDCYSQSPRQHCLFLTYSLISSSDTRCAPLVHSHMSLSWNHVKPLGHSPISMIALSASASFSLDRLAAAVSLACLALLSSNRRCRSRKLSSVTPTSGQPAADPAIGALKQISGRASATYAAAAARAAAAAAAGARAVARCA